MNVLLACIILLPLIPLSISTYRIGKLPEVTIEDRTIKADLYYRNMIFSAVGFTVCFVISIVVSGNIKL